MSLRVYLSTRLEDTEVKELWPVYAEVFADFDSVDAWREQVWDPHTGRDGFRVALARFDGELLGFAYGHTGRLGQWWTDRACEVLGGDVAASWLDGHFEIVSLGVVPRARGRGLGSALLDKVTERLPQDRTLLMTTLDEGAPARRLYRSRRFVVVGPGFAEDQVILGRRKRRLSRLFGETSRPL